MRMKWAMLAVSVLAAGLLLWGCGSPPVRRERPVRRYAWVTGIKPEKILYYKKLHAHPWPGVVRMIKACHIRNYSIYLKRIGDKYYLFSYLEYTGDDFDGDMKRMAADPETRRWWRETDPCQEPLPEAKAAGKIWSDAEEVFHLD